MSIEYINPDFLAPPSGFSHAVKTGDTVHLAGQTALDETATIVGGTVVEQFEKAMTNLLSALRAAGGDPKKLVSLTIYIVDMEEYKANLRDIGKVWMRLIGPVFPAVAAVAIERLWDIEAKVELQGVGYLG